GLERRSVSQDNQRTARGRDIDERSDHLVAGLVEPMDVFDDDDRRRAHPVADQCAHEIEQARLLCRRIDRQGRHAGHAKKFTEQGYFIAHLRNDLFDPRRDLSLRDLWTVAGGEAEIAAEKLDQRLKRAGMVVWRGARLQDRNLAFALGPGKLEAQSALSDTGR